MDVTLAEIIELKDEEGLAAKRQWPRFLNDRQTSIGKEVREETGRRRQVDCLITPPALLVSADEVIESNAFGALHECGNGPTRPPRLSSAMSPS
jgi:hypothetical protein